VLRAWWKRFVAYATTPSARPFGVALPDDMRLEALRVEVHELRRGDVIVLSLNHPLPQAQLASMREQLKSLFPRNRVLVLDNAGRFAICRSGYEGAEPTHD
jgi:virulence-associated protein VagC